MESRPSGRTLKPAYLAVREVLSTTSSSSSPSLGGSGVVDSPRPLYNHHLSHRLPKATKPVPHLLTRVVAKWLDRHCPSGKKLLRECLQASAAYSSSELRNNSVEERSENNRLILVMETMAGMEVVPPIRVHAMATVASVRSRLRMGLSGEQRRSGRVCLFLSNGREIVDEKVSIAKAVGLSTERLRDSGENRIVIRVGFQVPEVNYVEVSQRVAIALRSSIQLGCVCDTFSHVFVHLLRCDVCLGTT